MYFIVLPPVLASSAVADFSVTVLSNEAQQSLMLFRECSGLDGTVAFVIHQDDASRTNKAFLQFERGRNCSIGKQTFSFTQGYGVDHQPKIIDQVMLHQRLEQITASPNVQIGSFALLEFGNFLRYIPVQKHRWLPIGRSHGVRGDIFSCRVDVGPNVSMLRPKRCPNIKSLAP